MTATIFLDPLPCPYPVVDAPDHPCVLEAA